LFFRHHVNLPFHQLNISSMCNFINTKKIHCKYTKPDLPQEHLTQASFHLAWFSSILSLTLSSLLWNS
jgi:hypothetical protein